MTGGGWVVGVGVVGGGGGVVGGGVGLGVGS